MFYILHLVSIENLRLWYGNHKYECIQIQRYVGRPVRWDEKREVSLALKTVPVVKFILSTCNDKKYYF